MLGPVGNLIVFVTEMERAKRFYEDVLGFKALMAYPDWVQFEAAAGQPKLCLHGCDVPGCCNPQSPSLGHRSG